MTSDQDQRRRSSLAVWLVVAAVSLLPLYALSTGPAVWLRDRGYVRDEALMIYWPLEKLCQNCTPARKGFQLYLSCWGHAPAYID